MATKKAKVETTTIDFSNSIEKIKGTAKTVNTEVVDTTLEVLEDLKTNGEKIRAAATAKVQEAIENVTIDNGVKFVKETAQSIHQYNIETAEEIIEAAMKGGKAWQDFLAKSVKNGVDFFGQQQDITLTTLEELKRQYKTGNYNLKQLFNFDFSFSGGASSTKKAVTAKTKTTARKATKATTKKATAKKVAVKAVKTTKNATKKATVKATAKKVAAKAVKTAKPATKKVVAKATAKKVTKAATKNNLRTIEGIGPKIEGLLNQGGIFTFQQLADAPQAALVAILAAAGPRYKMHNPATWNQQAALAAAGKTAELAKLQDELKGGRATK